MEGNKAKRQNSKGKKTGNTTLDKKPIQANRTSLRTKTTPGLITCVVSDYFGAKMTQKAIAQKYGVHKVTVCRWIKQNEHMKSTYEGFNPEPIIERAKLPELERLKLFMSDALTGAERTVWLINQRLNEELTRDANAPGPRLSITDLTKILAELLPYILTKKEAGRKGEKEKQPDGRSAVLEMFRNQKMNLQSN